jgi:hypothetical protein
LILRTLCCSEDLGEYSNEEEAETRHANTYYADIDLDSWPHSDRQIIPRWIGRRCEMNEGLESNYAYDRDARFR